MEMKFFEICKLESLEKQRSDLKYLLLKSKYKKLTDTIEKNMNILDLKGQFGYNSNYMCFYSFYFDTSHLYHNDTHSFYHSTQDYSYN